MSEHASEPIALMKLDEPGSVVAYACGKCGAVVSSVLSCGEQAANLAREHCAPSKCTTCGVECRKHWTACDACSEKQQEERLQAQFEKAKKIGPGDWDGPVVDPSGRAGYGGSDGWCADLGDLIDYYVDGRGADFDRPTWVWATAKFYGFKPDAEDIIEGITSEMHEDAHEDFDAETLQTLLDKWFAKQDVVTHREDASVAIVLDANFWDDDSVACVISEEPEDARNEREVLADFPGSAVAETAQRRYTPEELATCTCTAEHVYAMSFASDCPLHGVTGPES